MGHDSFGDPHHRGRCGGRTVFPCTVAFIEPVAEVVLVYVVPMLELMS